MRLCYRRSWSPGLTVFKGSRESRTSIAPRWHHKLPADTAGAAGKNLSHIVVTDDFAAIFADQTRFSIDFTDSPFAEMLRFFTHQADLDKLDQFLGKIELFMFDSLFVYFFFGDINGLLLLFWGYLHQIQQRLIGTRYISANALNRQIY